MDKINRKVIKLDKLINELNFYLNNFNSPLKPRGEGARQCACLEFHNLMNKIHDSLYGLEELQLNKFGWSIEAITLVSEEEE